MPLVRTSLIPNDMFCCFIVLVFSFVLPFSGICHVYDGLSSQVAKSTLQDQTLSDRSLK